MKNLIILLIAILFWSCSSNKNLTEERVVITTTPEIINTPLQINFLKGAEHNHPSIAFWVEDLEGNYLETLFVTQFVAKGKFGYGEIESGKWENESGEVRRPATLPYWAHKRNIKAEDGLYIPSPKTAVSDALSGATPLGNFILETGSKLTSGKFRVLMEINQPWDSNKLWTNNKFQGDNDYFASLQPALVYAVTVDLDSEETEYFLNPIGHSHPSGKNGKLFTDISSHTTAKEIAHKIYVSLK
ncbi:MAG: hypothetical protein R3182_05895 [Draconibacterium sp.]|nr:hypothetical protein [Draconibacterium sp.]